MTSTLDALSSSLISNSLPSLFISRSYPSLRPLSSYFRDLSKRIEMFRNWIDLGPPKVFWLPGFFFTQSFFTGVLQNFARKQKISIEYTGWRVVVKSEGMEEGGVGVDGLWMEGGKWCDKERKVKDGVEGEVFFSMPEVLFFMSFFFFLCAFYRLGLFQK
jgi:dynein heavy chain